ncbi:MAG: tetratricopeptide repeat protein [Methanothrix sp.]
MSPVALWICMFLLIGSGAATDVPFVFDEESSDTTCYNSDQLEHASANSVELAGVPAIYSPSDNELMEFSTVGGGNAPSSRTEKKEEDLKKVVSARVEPEHFMVHEVALLLAAKFPGDLIVDQICSIYNYMKNGEGSVKGWSYVRDPIASDFFMYANQSLKIGDKSSCSGVGDCDDFAILMSALVESIGGTARIIFAQNQTIGGHAYAEVYLGNISDQNDQVEDIIGWLKQKFNTDKIFTHIDTDTKDVWLNLDWGPDEKGIAHPGGPFFQGDRHIVVYMIDDVSNTPLKLSATKKEGPTLNPAVPLNITTNEIESKPVDVWFNKGFALSSLGKYDEAIQAYDKVIELKPDYVEAWSNKGNALYDQGKYDEAIQAYDEAIRFNPNYVNAWSNKGSALGKQGKYEEAIKAYDEAIRLNPNYVNAWSNKGNALSKQGKYEEAIKAYDEAIRLNPKFASAWYNKGSVLGKQGEYTDAIEAYDQAIRIDPNDAEAWNSKGWVLYTMREYTDAIEAYDEAIRIDPNDAEAWNGKAWILYTMRKYNESLQAANKSLELDPKSANTWDTKGAALSGLGKYAEAVECYNKAIDLGLVLGEIWYRKSEALNALGRTAEANTAVAKAKELGYAG